MLRAARAPWSPLVALLIVGCSAAQVAVAPDSVNVRTGAQPPTGAYREVGAVTATHGGGCGLYGSRGSYEGAYTLLRNKAARLGANYVQILRITEPHLEGICAHRAYTIDGLAYSVAAINPSLSAQPRAVSRGSGFLVRPDAVTLTAFHVIENANITAVCANHPPAAASIAQVARNNDLALLRVSSLSDTPYLSLAKPRSVSNCQELWIE